MLPSFRIRPGRITLNPVSYYGSKSQGRQNVNVFKKMLDRMEKSKQKSQKPSPVLLEKGTMPSPYQNQGLNIRLLNLNKLYMEQITLMLNSGKYGRQFDDLGIQISKVNWAAGLNFLHIYWVRMKKDIPEDVINETLLGALGELQEQMGSVRFTSKVPLLKFVQDLRLEREMHLDDIFQSADFGRDFDPVYGKKVVTPDFVSKEYEMPEMRQNVLGLDHAKIKGRIMAEIVKFKAIDTAPAKHDDEEEEEEEKKQRVPHKLIRFNKVDFLKFYKRRRILALKMRKKEKQAGVNVQYEYEDTYEDEIDEEEYAADEDVLEEEEEKEEEDKRRFKT